METPEHAQKSPRQRPNLRGKVLEVTYLWPEKPTFLGFLIMVSIFSFLKRSVLWGPKVEFGIYGLGDIWNRIKGCLS